MSTHEESDYDSYCDNLCEFTPVVPSPRSRAARDRNLSRIDAVIARLEADKHAFVGVRKSDPVLLLMVARASADASRLMPALYGALDSLASTVPAPPEPPRKTE